MTLTHKTTLTTLITISLFLIFSHTIYAATYYVDTNNVSASDANTGTSTSPWKTIQHAADTLVAGDTVYIKAGTYREGQAIKPKNSGTSDANRITYAAYPGSEAIVNGQPNSAPRVVIDGEWNGVYKNQGGGYTQPGHNGFWLSDDDYITIKGFEIINTWGAGVGMSDTVNGSTNGYEYFSFHENNIIEDNYIHGVHGVWGGNIAGIKFNSCKDCTARNNIVDSMYTTQSNGSEVEVFAGINTNGILGYGMPGAIIENNKISNAENGVHHKRAPNIPGLTVKNNIIYDVNNGVHLAISGTGNPPHLDSSVYNNIIYNVSQGVNTTTGWPSTSEDLYIHDNIFYNVSISFSYRFHKDVEIYNNILAAGPDGLSAKLYNYKCDQLAELNYSDYNIFTPATGTKGFALYAGCGTNNTKVVATSFADWQSKLALPSAGLMISNPDANSFEASASDLFVNPSGGDFTFTSNGASLVSGAGRYGDDIGVLACSVGPHADCINPPPPPTPDTTPPTASAGPDQSVTTNQQITVDGSASTDNIGITSYTWDFMASDGIQSDATGSTATHTYTTQGSYTVTLTVQDAAGNTGTDTLVVTVNDSATPPPSPQCSDTIDNDGDGKTDYPNDPGCSSSTDTDEYDAPTPTPGGGGTTPTTTQCSDGIDNDGDGYVDFGSDRDCTSRSDTTEGISTTPTVVDTPGTIDDGGIDITTGITKRFSTLYGPFAFGHRTPQVTLLQQILASDPSIYPEGEITGYYGNLTVKAVQTFQCKYLSLCSGTPSSNGYGLAGPSTRSKINTVFQQNTTPTVTTTTTTTNTLDQATRDSIQAQINALNAILLTLLEQLAVLLAGEVS